MSITLAEEILLLILDEKGTFPLMSQKLNFVFAGAVLMELAIENRIDCQLDTLQVVDKEPLNDPILDKYLQKICDKPEHKELKFWINSIADDGNKILDMGLQRLVERGIRGVSKKRFLWKMLDYLYPTLDGTIEREVKHRIMSILYRDEIPDLRDAVIISLMDACELFPTLLEPVELNRLQSRISDVSQLDLIGQTTTNLIRREIQIQRSLLHALVLSG